jgi:hypothetical protein
MGPDRPRLRPGSGFLTASSLTFFREDSSSSAKAKKFSGSISWIEPDSRILHMKVKP